MIRQTSFSAMERSRHARVTRREKFLGEMERVVPWAQLVAAVAPHYPKSGRRGRPPIGLERMLRMYFLQQWYGLADEALEDALYDSMALRQFVGIDLGVEAVPDATTLLQFRHLLERESLTRSMFEQINVHLSQQGLLMRQGTLVDATLIAAPPSTKNQAKQRDPDMVFGPGEAWPMPCRVKPNTSKKGNQWYFGMKAHIGADAESGAVHSVATTAGNQADISQAHAVLHGDEQDVHLDAGYVGVDKRPEVIEAQGQGRIRKDLNWHIAAKRSTYQQLPEGAWKDRVKAFERVKAQIRARVEHPFHVIKNLFGYRKVRYKGLAKNTAQLFTLFGLANLVILKQPLLALHGKAAS